MLDAAAALRADLGPLAGAVTDRLRTQVPSYALVPTDVLAPRVERAIRNGLSIVQRLSYGASAPAPRPEPPTRTGSRRPVGDTLPVEDVISAYRIGVDVVWARFSKEMTARQASAEDLLTVAEHVWSWAAAMTLRIVRRHGSGVAEGPASVRQREALVRRLLLKPDAFTVTDTTVGGIDRSTVRMPFRARAAGGGTGPAGVVELLRPWIAVHPDGGPLVTTVEGDVAGLLVSRPAGIYRHLVVGLGAAVRPYEFAEEFAEATQAFRTAVSFGLAGAFSCEDLGLRVTVLAEPALGERLVRQVLAPLRERGEEGAQLEDAVAAYLDHGMRLEAAARSAYVHPNTMRNRLRRFEEVSGVSLRDPAGLAEVWWALAHQRVHGHRGSTPS